MTGLEHCTIASTADEWNDVSPNLLQFPHTFGT